MRPESTELIETLDQVLGERIVPLVHDAHALARIVVMRQIFGHLYQRVRLEGQYMWDDNAELVELLGGLADDLPGIGIREALAQADAVVEPGSYPSLALQDEKNTVLKNALVTVIENLDTLPEEVRERAESAVKVYLRHQLDREDELCRAPVFGSENEKRDLSLV